MKVPKEIRDEYIEVLMRVSMPEDRAKVTAYADDQIRLYEAGGRDGWLGDSSIFLIDRCGYRHRPDQVSARAVPDHILVTADYYYADGRCLETNCGDYDAYMALPRVVEKDGTRFGLTGWNSDRGVAYYKSTAATARAV